MCLNISSLCKKQIVAVTGLMLILFIIGHLVGNLFIYGGPEAFNGYSEKLESLGNLLLVIEYALAAVFIVHIFMTASLVIENIKARGGLSRYAVDVPQERRNFATKIMPYTGSYIFAFLIWHLLNFKFADDSGSLATINGKELELYGLVVNFFKNPVHDVLYVLAMCCLGFHLAHGFQSLFQTLGINNKYTPLLKKASVAFGLLIAVGFSSIPIYVLLFLR